MPDTEHKCTNFADIKLACVKGEHDTAATWKPLRHDEHIPLDMQGQCPSNSVPWHAQVLCGLESNEASANKSAPSQCFATTLGERDGAICLLSAPETSVESMKKELVTSDFPLSHDRPIAPTSSELAALVPCYIQTRSAPVVDAQNLTIVGYARNQPHCTAQLAEVEKECTDIRAKGGKCGISNVFAGVGDDYTCILDTRRLPVSRARSNHEWWRWIRQTEYACRDNQWKCTGSELGEYTSPVCVTDADCRVPVETGVCDVRTGVCHTGSTKGSRCKSHEDCDMIHATEPKCTNSRCQRGKTGIDAVYYAPQTCSLPTSSRTGRHTYCGAGQDADGNEIFTGVCEEFVHKGTTHTGCREFTSQVEINKMRKEEEDWQSIHKNPNFHGQTPTWEKLGLCPADATLEVDGHIFCKYTRQKVPIHTTVRAESATEAREQCDTQAAARGGVSSGLKDAKGKVLVRHLVTKIDENE